MSTAIIKRFTEERESIAEFVERTLAGAAEQERDLSATEMEALEASKTRMAAIEEQLTPLLAWQQQRDSAVVVDKLTGPAPVRTQPRAAAPAGLGALGDMFVASEEYRGYRGGTGARYEYAARPSEIRAPLMTTSDPGQLLLPKPAQYTAVAPAALTPLLAAITRIPVAGNSVDVVTYGPGATGAAVVPEGELKPEATMTVTSTPTILETIAATAMASRQLLADAEGARIFVNSQLVRGVLSALEAEIQSVVSAAPIPALTANAGEELLAQMRRGVSVVQAAGYSPNIVLASPNSLAQTDLTVLGLGGSSAAVVGSGYWGLTPVPVPNLPDNEVYIADAAAAMVLFEKAGVELFVTDSDIIGEGATAQSAFRRNVISFVCETRAKAAIVQPAAAVKLTP